MKTQGPYVEVLRVIPPSPPAFNVDVMRGILICTFHLNSSPKMLFNIEPRGRGDVGLCFRIIFCLLGGGLHVGSGTNVELREKEKGQDWVVGHKGAVFFCRRR